jgi:hypothetical protein
LKRCVKSGKNTYEHQDFRFYLPAWKLKSSDSYSFLNVKAAAWGSRKILTDTDI